MADILIPTIRFVDIAAREKAAREAITSSFDNLTARLAKLGQLSQTDAAELARVRELKALIDSDKGKFYFDPLFATARAALKSAESGLRPRAVEHEQGVLQFPEMAGDKATEAERDAEVARVGLILGLLQYNGTALPRLVVSGKTPQPDPEDPNTAEFGEGLFRAVGRIAGRTELAERTLKQVGAAVNIQGDRKEPGVSSAEYAKVFEGLVGRGVTAHDVNLKRLVEDQFDKVQALGDDQAMHDVLIDLPDLEATTAFEVVASHCKLMGSFIFASAFEELKAFQVVDKLVEMSQRGDLALIKGPAGTQLYNYWREAPNRMSESERQGFYAMMLGLPTGQPGVKVNVEFQDLWLRFVSSVSTLVREARVDALIRAATPMAVNQQQVKKAARDLATNMSLHGYGMAFYAAADLQKQINDMISLLQDKELLLAIGQKDMWGVIDQVAQTELGGARNSSKYRMLATSGAIISSWIANNNDRLRDPTSPMIDLGVVSNPPTRPRGQSAVSHPNDYDLVNACEMWLADSAMDEGRIEQMSQPREAPNMTSRPIQIPSIARDLLDSAGLGMGMGYAQAPQSNGHARNGYGY
ncbi:hypothetical protein HNP52_001233 [Sphingomonas kyeonggiensis]|uniref:Uncharacterized protein n=1 Tax=Sphingomonas kyeonggiensis TaxID=1268553 RepID=A0A7W7K011_9SPHN|nr:hypothetical protein [Sphingomonas kyeonggiensis]MBB4838182.1 hypothetical protein [Sphingomonas kyeonggiensis]